MFQVYLPARLHDAQHRLRKAEQIAWDPDSCFLAVHWTLATASSPTTSDLEQRARVVNHVNPHSTASWYAQHIKYAKGHEKMPCYDVDWDQQWTTAGRHVVSIHKASDGACSGTFDLAIAWEGRDGCYACCASPCSLQWLPPSCVQGDGSGLLTRQGPRLVCTVQDKICMLDASAQCLWTSTGAQRGFHPEHCLLAVLDTTMTWVASPTGRFLLVVDDYDMASASDNGAMFPAQLSILSVSCGSEVLHRWAHQDDVGQVVWASHSDTCLLSEHGLIISPNLGSPAGADQTGSISHKSGGLTWHQQRLMDADKSWDSRVYRLGSSSWGSFQVQYLNLSPCGRVVVGFSRQKGYTASPPPLLLQHWQLSDGRGTQPMQVHLQVFAGSLLLRDPAIEHLAWHPQPNALIYAMYDGSGGVHLIDARETGCIRSWTRADLSEAHSKGDASRKHHYSCLPTLNALQWSPDGCRLAIFLRHAAAVVAFE